jgi:hypothetical protein
LVHSENPGNPRGRAENTGGPSSFQKIEASQSVDSFIQLTLKYPQQETGAPGDDIFVCTIQDEA